MAALLISSHVAKRVCSATSLSSSATGSADGQKYRPYWYIQLELPCFGNTGCLSARTSNKRKAERYESLLRWLDDNEHWEILDVLKPQGRGKSGKVTLGQVYRARREDRIQEMKRKLTDPKLRDAIAAATKSIDYNNHRTGLRHILALAPENARLSWATKPTNINGMVATLKAKGLQENSIRNSLWVVFPSYSSTTTARATHATS